MIGRGVIVVGRGVIVVGRGVITVSTLCFAVKKKISQSPVCLAESKQIWPSLFHIWC